MKRAWKAVLAGLFVAAIALPASALGPETFNNFDTEDPLTSSNPGIGTTDSDWRYTGDQGVRDVAIEGSGIDDNTLRISNAYTDSSFGNWLFSPKLPNGGVTEDDNGNKFIAEFDMRSATGTPQPGAQVSVSPQSGDGARMSFLRFVDDGSLNGGIDVIFVDNQDNDGLAQRSVEIASNLSRTDVHEVRIELDLYTGPHNDVAQVFIDGSDGLIPMLGDGFTGFFAPVDNPSTANKVKAGQSVPMKWKFGGATPATTWEDYYRFTPESNADPVQDPNTPGTELLPQPWGTRPVDSLIFQARTSGGTALSTLGGGFLFDNVELTTGATGTLPKGGAAGDPSVYGTPVFKYQTVNCDGVTDLDALETADAPGASTLTYDAATGIWHYNWQTSKSMIGSCVKLTLQATGDYALFKISK